MSRRRSKEQVIAEILATCQDGASKTKIVYASNINSRTVKPYIEGLAADGLLETVPGQVMLYQTTQKGLKVLGHLKALEELMPSFGLKET